LESETVGFETVLQQTPFAETETLPENVTTPPLFAELEVTLDIPLVVTGELLEFPLSEFFFLQADKERIIKNRNARCFMLAQFG
jgi:hypothetical protein